MHYTDLKKTMGNFEEDVQQRVRQNTLGSLLTKIRHRQSGNWRLLSTASSQSNDDNDQRNILKSLLDISRNIHNIA